MSETRINIYEGMFLFPQSATSDLQGAVDHVKAILDRADAEVVAMSKWDERRLAYEIKGNKRGVYFLVYFRADASKMTDVERACNLSEQLLRSMILRADHIPSELIEATEGQAQLADEIKMRADAPAAERAGHSSSVSTRADREAAEAAAKAEAKKKEAEAAAAAADDAATATATAEPESEGEGEKADGGE